MRVGTLCALWLLGSAPALAQAPVSPQHLARVRTAAARLGLPVAVGAYTLRDLAIDRDRGPDDHRHFLYSDGAHAISVFVVFTDRSALRHDPAWHRESLGGLPAYSYEERARSRAMVVWLQSKQRRTAAARLPLPTLLGFVHTLAEKSTAKR